MKVFKGLIAYSIILIVVLAVVGGLLFGAMFLFPGFSLFDWCVIKNNTKTLTNVALNKTYQDNIISYIGTPTFSGEGDMSVTNSNVLNINVNAGGYPVKITTYDDTSIAPMNIIRVAVQSNYFGMVKKQVNPITDVKFTPKPEVYVTVSGYDINRKEYFDDLDTYISKNSPEGDPTRFSNKYLITSINVEVPEFESQLFSYSDSLIQIVLPTENFKKYAYNAQDEKTNVYYNLNIKTTSGSVTTEGTIRKESEVVGRAAPRNILQIKNVDITTASGDVTLQHFQRGDMYVTEDNLCGYYYDDKVVLDSLKLTTENGKFYIFNNYYNYGKSAKEHVLTLSDTSKTIEINANKGDFYFYDIKAPINLYGNNIKISANNIDTCDTKFVFNSDNGIFKVNSISCGEKTAEIVTQNTDINCGTINSDAFIETTYGNINVGEILGKTKLTSTHGNIVLGKAKGTIMASSTYGDIICVKSGHTTNGKNDGGFYGKAMFSNKNGKIEVEFNESDLLQGYDVNVINETLVSITNEKGSITATNLVTKSNIVSNGSGTITVKFLDMADVEVEHYINSKNGTSNVYCPTSANGFGNSIVFSIISTGTTSGEINGTKITKSEKDSSGNYIPVVYPPKGDTTNAKCLVRVDGNVTFYGIVKEAK